MKFDGERFIWSIVLPWNEIVYAKFVVEYDFINCVAYVL